MTAGAISNDPIVSPLPTDVIPVLRGGVGGSNVGILVGSINGAQKCIDVGALSGPRIQIANAAVNDGSPDPDTLTGHWLRSYIAPFSMLASGVGFLLVPPGVSSEAIHPYSQDNSGPVSGVISGDCRVQLISRARAELAVSNITPLVNGWNYIPFVTPVQLTANTIYRLRFAAKSTLGAPGDIVGTRGDSGYGTAEISARITQRVGPGTVWSDFPALLEPGAVAIPSVGAVSLSTESVDPYFRILGV